MSMITLVIEYSYHQLEEKESKKIQKPKPHRGRRKLDPELKPHREKPNERFSSFQIDKQTISSGSNDIHSARRSTSDTSVHCQC